MHHLFEILISLYFWLGLIVLLNYHHLPKVIWKPFGVLFQKVWWPVKWLDSYLFKVDKELKEIKKSRFKKIVSPFGKLFLLIIAFIVYIGDALFFTPLTGYVNRLIESDEMKKTIAWFEKQNIIVLRIFVGIPFFFMEITGIIAGILFLSMPLVALVVYLSKFAWVVPFKFIDKVGHDKLSKDPWYSGLKSVAVKAIDAVISLEVVKSLHNKIVAVKNFMKDSNHNTMLEIKIRKKLFVKTFKEIWSLNHLTDELSDSSDVNIVFFGAAATKKLNILKENPDNQFFREDLVDYVLSEFKPTEDKVEINKENNENSVFTKMYNAVSLSIFTRKPILVLFVLLVIFIFVNFLV